MKKQNILGLDLGTNSVGYSLVSETYTPIRHKGKLVSGVLKFKENEVASNQDRRAFRTSRRSLRKRHDRIRLINKIFINCHEINYKIKYPTLWHLQKAIINGEESNIDYLYSLIKTIMKHRGNFYELRPDLKEDESKIKEEKLEGFTSFYNMQINKYETYRKNLNKLKRIAFKNKTFNTIFKNKDSLFKKLNKNEIDLEDFFEESNLPVLDLLKQRVNDNALIPNWIHEDDLRETLIAFSKNSDKLSTKDIDEILNIFTFTIPFYVGPLSGEFSWCKRKSKTPLNKKNIENVIDLKETMTSFIENMTSNCTYLENEKALPKQSLIHEMVQLLNQLNVITINGKRINKDQKIFLFEEAKKVKLTEKSIPKKLLKANLIKKEDLVYVPILNTDIKTYRDLNKILGNKIQHKEFIEKIIKECSIFASEPNYLKKILTDIGTSTVSLTKDEIESIINLEINGWSRLSKAFLIESYTEKSKDRNIFDILYNESENLQEIIYGYGFDKLKTLPAKFSFDIIENAPISPSAKKTTRKVVNLLNEILDKGLKIDKICIESTRTNRAKKDITTERKSELKKLYKNDPQTLKDLESVDLKDNKTYLYFKQKKRCLYSGEIINLDNNEFDKDHIYPKSKIKDDSPHKNLVLVKKTLNLSKSNEYPLDPKVQDDMKDFWKELLNEGFMSEEKYLRLTRTTPLSEDELENFVQAQLVSTSQANKFTKDLIEKYFKIPVVFIKAEIVTDFRYAQNRYGKMYKKDRDINDFHHAHDAYFTAIVGNVFDERVTRKFFKKNTNISNLFKKEDEFWSNDYLRKLDKFLNINIDVREEVREGRGKLFNTSIVSPKKQKDKTFYLELKKNKTLKEGGYASLKTNYFTLMDLEIHSKKGKTKTSRCLIPIPSVFKDNLITNELISNILKRDVKIIKIVIKKLYAGTKFNINGLNYIIKGKTGDYIICKKIGRPTSEPNERIRFDSFNI